jgi:hypothetical protein
MIIALFWDVTPCGSCKNRSFRETSVLTRATRRNITEDCVLHDYDCGDDSDQDKLFIFDALNWIKFSHHKTL